MNFIKYFWINNFSEKIVTSRLWRKQFTDLGEAFLPGVLTCGLSVIIYKELFSLITNQQFYNF